MKAFIKALKTSLILLLSLFILPICACGGETKTGSDFTTMSALHGEVLVKKSGAAEWSPGKVDMKLEKGDIIKSSADSRLTVTFFDGSTIELEPNTEIEITELLKNDGNTIRLKQQIGQSISTIRKLADTASRYEIETPAAVVAVRGSQMLLRVTQDGSTFVQNLEGHISVIAQGLEVAIPTGSACTVKPGEPPASPVPAASIVASSSSPATSLTSATTTSTSKATSVTSIVTNQNDPENDVFDSKGNKTTGQPYQDIAGIDLRMNQDKTLYILTIELYGDVPTTTEEGIFMEWDLMVDSDKNEKTGWSTGPLFSGIGADYYLNAFLSGSQVLAGGFVTANTSERFTDVQVTVTGKFIELKFPPKDIGDTAQFRYIVLTRKYDTVTKPNVLLGADRISNQGYLSFPSSR
jgi:hypothetical protein